jgi:ferredoxin
MKMAKTPYVDQEECTGCGLCEEVCPEVFRLNEDAVSEVYNSEGASEESIQEAIDSCPVECIHWKEE